MICGRIHLSRGFKYLIPINPFLFIISHPFPSLHPSHPITCLHIFYCMSHPFLPSHLILTLTNCSPPCRPFHTMMLDYRHYVCSSRVYMRRLVADTEIIPPLFCYKFFILMLITLVTVGICFRERSCKDIQSAYSSDILVSFLDVAWWRQDIFKDTPWWKPSAQK